jgi:hypothetical protein
VTKATSPSSSSSPAAEPQQEEEETVRFFVTRLKMSKFKVGDLVWVKLRSFPWWPAQVLPTPHRSALSELIIINNQS